MAVTLVPEPPKKAYLSKTMWLNLLMAIVALVGAWVPSVANIMSAETVAMVMAMVNMLMRLISKEKVVLW